jgi:hypothetical protein
MRRHQVSDLEQLHSDLDDLDRRLRLVAKLLLVVAFGQENPKSETRQELLGEVLREGWPGRFDRP